MPKYRLRDRDKDFLREKFGELYSGSSPVKNAENLLSDIPDGARLYLVGDYCAEKFFKAGAEPEVVVYDGKVEKKDYRALKNFLENFEIIRSENSAGEISEKAYNAVERAVSSGNTAVKIDGEEDLLGLAVVDCADPGSFLAYGDPGISGEEGIRLVEVDEFKEEVGEMLES